ncbi:hypothetical protein MKW94_024129 [Papaver nudicaule]|uniref:Large ribosomal subunit protein uL2 C-terminal domain-containing protein n=1 Tax=Papaver nudicaule TaxID=74823 RepID=A0AA41VSH4_PAPNU|nr:hypothetical protein [Papaver nudicaule]
MHTGQFLYCGKKANLMVGNVLPSRSIPEGAVVCNVEHHVGDKSHRGTLARASGDCAIPSGAKIIVPGQVDGGGRTEKLMSKAGNANPVEHLYGGGNHQHIGHASAVRRDAPPGQKVGLIAAWRTGSLRGQAAALAFKTDKASVSL